jgi:hypothetical protein
LSDLWNTPKNKFRAAKKFRSSIKTVFSSLTDSKRKLLEKFRKADKKGLAAIFGWRYDQIPNAVAYSKSTVLAG